jgi:cellulose synthase/poly-beta-1,6-N-acetylglucosamine synthase-like glycosyltransferase
VLHDSGAHEIVAVFDADTRSHPDYLANLVGPFSDDAIGAVCGFMNPTPEPKNAISLYSSLEYWVNQCVVLAAKDKLAWNPPMLGGNCAYRSTALHQAGGFPSEALSEDIELSMEIVSKGWRTRLLRQAVSNFSPATSFRHFHHQRQRWTRGLMHSARRARGLESVAMAAGYIDRVALLGALGLVIAGWLSPLWLLLYCVPVMATVAAALLAVRPSGPVLARLLVVVAPMFCADVRISLTSVVGALTKRSFARLTRSEAEASS